MSMNRIKQYILFVIVFVMPFIISLGMFFWLNPVGFWQKLIALVLFPIVYALMVFIAIAIVDELT